MKPVFLVLAAICAHAQTTALQVDLYQLTTTGEVAVGTTLNIGTAAPGDIKEVQLRLRSRETRATNITPLSASSTAAVFTVENQFLPYTMAPGTNYDFRVRFSPLDPGAFTGTLFVLDKKIALVATSPEAATVQAQRGAAFETLTSASTVDFGSVERKQSAVRQFALVNKTAQAIIVRSVAISGAGYALEGLTLPVTLAQAATRTFAVRFAPLVSGILRAKLSVEGREFTLEGFATEPPFPSMSFVVPTARSGQQATFKIRFSTSSPAVGTIKVTLSGLEPDAAAVLLPLGSRLLSVPVKEGDTEYSINLQTGTTAGTLKLAADLATQHVETQLVLAPLAPVFSTMTLVRSNGRIEMRITGFDNTRSLNAANFSFYDRNGTIIGSTLGASVGDAFTRYFGTSTLAGQFALAASFPVQGDIQAITNVDVELINAQGSTRTGKVGF